MQTKTAQIMEKASIDRIFAIYAWVVISVSILASVLGLNYALHGDPYIGFWSRAGIGLLVGLFGIPFWFVVLTAFAGLYDTLVLPLLPLPQIKQKEQRKKK